MTATDELRKMLDERDEYYKTSGNRTWWGRPTDARTGEPINVFHNQAQPMGEDRLFVELQLATPEQAIEATLGRGECHNLAGQDEDGEWGFCCSECGARPKYDSGEVHVPSSGELPDGTVWLGDSWVPWRYCPNCGRRVVGA